MDASSIYWIIGSVHRPRNVRPLHTQATKTTPRRPPLLPKNEFSMQRNVTKLFPCASTHLSEIRNIRCLDSTTRDNRSKIIADNTPIRCSRQKLQTAMRILIKRNSITKRVYYITVFLAQHIATEYFRTDFGKTEQIKLHAHISVSSINALGYLFNQGVCN